MTNHDCLNMFNGLQIIKQPSFADIKDFANKEDLIFHAKFLKAVSLTKRKLDPIIESIKDAEKPSDEYNEYMKGREDILSRWSKKDAEGNPLTNVEYINNRPQRSFNIPALLDRSSEASRELKKYDDKNKEIIDLRKRQDEQLLQMLKEPSNFVPEKVIESMIPSGLDPKVWDAIIFMIEDDTDEPKPIKYDKTKKK